MTRPRSVQSHDPAAVRTADQSTRSASGLSTGQRRTRARRVDAVDDELVNRYARNLTPRRYEQPIADDEK